MPSAREIATSLASICTVVPPAAPGLCERCHRPAGEGWARCYSCNTVERQLSAPCPLIVPISLTELQGQLHYQLRNYKADESQMAQSFLIRTAAILGYFLHKHSGCIAEAAGGDWDVITSVPSSTDRIGDHPLVRAIRAVGSLRDQYEPLLRRGEQPTGHLIASDEGFLPTRKLAGERVLLIDDTFTSGARAQSAASALSIAGASVAAIVPIGRVISPEFNEETAEYWKRQSALEFDFDVCCLCGS